MKEISVFVIFISFVWGMTYWLLNKIVEDLKRLDDERKRNDFC